uniref:Uncharacterized protein n=1 Tax=Pyxicephalus adspersus TaxID=30357 RepID=A0AAV3A949_PYXAD|nr:TPA: hypothetical protein GDO54_017550 [Pyxicephalus adspersus]
MHMCVMLPKRRQTFYILSPYLDKLMAPLPRVNLSPLDIRNYNIYLCLSFSSVLALIILGNPEPIYKLYVIPNSVVDIANSERLCRTDFCPPLLN